MGNAHDTRAGNPNIVQDPTRQNIQGTQNPNGSDQGFNYSEKNLEYVEFKETDEAYGEIRVYRLNNPVQQQGQQTPSGQSAVPPENISQLEIGIKSKIFDSQEESNEYLHGLNAKKALKHPNVVPFLKINSVTNSNLCTSIYKIDIALEYNRNNIETELLHRFQTKEFFAESSIFDMIEQVMSAMQYLKQHNIYHGDIQPRTILFGPNDEFKITDVQFLTNGMCGYRKHLAGIETECFLAPELLQPLRRQNVLSDGEIDQERADIFSLGLVALAASILQSVESVYNFEDYCLREEEMLNHLDLVKTHYSNDLYLLLVSMLNQVDRRIDLDTGLNLISQMRAGQFNQEEYELKRFQSELQNSEKKLAQSSQYVTSLDKPNTHPDTVQFSLNPSNPQQPTVAPNVVVVTNPLNSQIQVPQDKELAYAQEQEILKRTAAAATNQPNLNSQNQNQQYQQLQNGYDIHPSVTPVQQSTPNQQTLQTPSQYLQENTLNNPRNLVGTLTPSNKNSQGLGPANQGYVDQQKSDRYDNHPHQFVQSNTNSQPISVNGSYQAYQQANSGYPSNVYPASTSAPASNTFNSHNLDEIDARVREALLRSQQVSLKFENSPLRQFRDQLLADELYIPQDVNQSLSRSRQQLSSSAKKNPQISQSQSKAYSNYPIAAGSGLVGASVRKFVSDFPKKQQSQQGSKFINQKWRI